MATDRQARTFFRAAQDGNEKRLKALIDRGASVNDRDPRTGATALHYAAAHQARDALRVLIKTGQCDHLIRDKAGRLPSELAGIHGRDPALARLLLRKEVEQARQRGVELHRREARKEEPGRAPDRSRRKDRDRGRER